MASVSGTFTGTTGPGQAVTSLALSNISNINVDFLASIIKVSYTPNGGAPRTFEMMYSNIATVTWTVSGGNTTLVFTT